VCELVESCHILQTDVTNYFETFVPVYPISYCLGIHVIVIRLLAMAKVFHLRIVQTECDVYTTSYSKRAEEFFPCRLNWKEREDGYLPMLGAEVKNEWCRCLHSHIFVNDVRRHRSDSLYCQNIHNIYVIYVSINLLEMKRTAVFWVITQRVVVHVLLTFRDKLSVPSSRAKTPEITRTPNDVCRMIVQQLRVSFRLSFDRMPKFTHLIFDALFPA